MKKYLPVILNIALLLLASLTNAKAQHIELLEHGKPTSIRGLSVVDDKVAWVSGSSGTIAITKDAGKNWNWQQVKGFEKADFRDIEAFSDKEAIIMSSGTPALILKTMDGGANWQVKYRNADTAYFLDAMDFADKKHGFVLGDPINNKFLLLETKDGGENWLPFKNSPIALPGEAAFAASGTCLRFLSPYYGFITIVTGGVSSRLISNTLHNEWEYSNLPITHGKPSQGAFSFASGKNNGIVVGGDYVNDKKTDSIAAIHEVDPFLMFPNPVKGPAGYQSCVEFILNDTFLSTGTPGSNITTDGGKTWTRVDDTSYNVCRKAKQGTLVLLAGDRGKIGILKP